MKGSSSSIPSAAAIMPSPLFLWQFKEGRIQEAVSCMPCSRTYIGDAGLNSLTGQLPQHHDLAEVSDSDGLCKGLAADDVQVPTLSELHRKLVGEGSHRRLVYSVKLSACQDAMANFLDGRDAYLVITEKLPNGVFADPFELQRSVERKVFHDVAVFGDANLESPSALSNRSAVEVHVDLSTSASVNCDLVIDLPLHARYPPLDGSGYATVEFGSPELVLRYRRKKEKKEEESVRSSGSCLWALQSLDAAAAVERVRAAAWRVPCGDEAHVGLVSGVTLLSALVCSVSLVVASRCYLVM